MANESETHKFRFYFLNHLINIEDQVFDLKYMHTDFCFDFSSQVILNNTLNLQIKQSHHLLF